MFSAFKKFGRMGGGSSIPWTPTKLFAAGEKGGLWDFSTLANLYQDSAGTTPCTAVGDPIGLVLDTSGRGNHLTQSTSTQRPTLGRMPATGVRNLLVNTATLSTQSVTTTAQNYTIQFTGAGSITASGTYSGALTNGQTFTCTDGTLTLTVSGSVTNAQLEAGSTATAYQKVGAAYDVTESGVASVYTAYFDGVDDCLVSPSIDFSGTDKMTVWAGVRKTTETGLLDCLLECGDMFASATGAFGLNTKANSIAGNASFGSRGTMDKYSLRALPINTSAILTGVGDIGAPSVNLSVSGVSGAATTTSQGGGTYPNSIVKVGCRIGDSYNYKGFLSALCTRGAATDAATVTSMEKWLAARTPGVTLP